jgi:hypothetical protein
MKKLIGASPVMERLREDILDLGQADSHVLIDGRNGHGQDAGRPCAARRGAAGREEVHHADLLRGLRRGCAGEKLFGPIPEDTRCPLVEEARGGTLCWRISRRCPTRSRRGF